LQTSKRLLSHSAYLPGEQPKNQGSVVKLNTNENPYPPSPSLTEAILTEIPRLNLYPSPLSVTLREEIAQLHSLQPNQVIIGNGSDDILNLCVRTYADEELKVGMLEPSYSLYEVLAGVQGSELIRIAFSDDQFSIEPEKVATCGANLFFLTNPHAPSGRLYSMDQISRVAQKFPGLLVIDEAYADFASENAVSLVKDFDNVLITRTFSKSYSLAGLRVGYGLGHASVICQLDKVREVYNLDRLAQAGALAALRDRKYFQECLEKVIEQRNVIASQFDDFGWHQIPSSANFIFVQPKCSENGVGTRVALSLFKHLSEDNILVRYFPKHPQTSSFLRISIGKPCEMSILMDSIKTWRQKKQQG
jgi:histidinol-phosphate aminotransferase